LIDLVKTKSIASSDHRIIGSSHQGKNHKDSKAESFPKIYKTKKRHFKLYKIIIIFVKFCVGWIDDWREEGEGEGEGEKEEEDLSITGEIKRREKEREK